MTSVTSLKVFQNKIKEWKSKSLPQREQKLQSLAIEKQQTLWQLKQIELEEQALPYTQQTKTTSSQQTDS